MTTDEFRATLQRLRLSQGELARLLAQLGDGASHHTILRRVERWAQGVSAVPGEAAALLGLLVRFPGVLRALRTTGAAASRLETANLIT